MASIYSVSQVNAYIKNMFSQDFALNRISIKGEVSNCKYHTSRPCNCTNIIFPIWSKLVQVAVLKKDYVIWLDVGQKAKTIRMTLPHPCKTPMSKVI